MPSLFEHYFQFIKSVWLEQNYMSCMISDVFLAQGTVLVRSLALHGLLSLTSCQVTVSSLLRTDNQDLSVELSQSCRTPHLSGTLTHSFRGLKSLGVPEIITMEAAAPEGPEEAGALLLKIGTCFIRARGTPQEWALESTCPVSQVAVI